MPAIVWNSNLGSGYNEANCKECSWKGHRQEGGVHGYDRAMAEADAHNTAQHDGVQTGVSAQRHEGDK